MDVKLVYFLLIYKGWKGKFLKALNRILYDLVLKLAKALSEEKGDSLFLSHLWTRSKTTRHIGEVVTDLIQIGAFPLRTETIPHLKIEENWPGRTPRKSADHIIPSKAMSN